MNCGGAFAISAQACLLPGVNGSNRRSNVLSKRSEEPMKSRMLSAQMAAIALAAAASSSPALAQQSKGTLYAFHSSPVVGGCPGLDWHVMLSADHKVSGFVAWDHGKYMARLDGELNKDGSFELVGKEVGSGKTATVKGTTGGDYINATIEGSGTACDGDNLAVPRVVGGTEGGGG